jgi:hypothetical protein
MRNYADEIHFIETVRTRRCVPRTTLSTSSDSSSQAEEVKGTIRRKLKCRWVLVDEKLELVWSEDREEPLRWAA